MAEKREEQITVESMQSDETENVDKIRDILFGNQMRDYDRRFKLMEERLFNELKTLRGETTNRLDALENYTRNEVDTLSEGLALEKKEREVDEKEIMKNHHDSAKSFEKKVSQIEERQGKNQRDLNQQILDRSKALTHEISSTREELSQTLELAVEELRSGKTDRTALASLFTEVAMQLGHDDAGPKGN